VPLSEAGTPYGVMLLRLPEGIELADWKLKLLESIGHHIGAALATAKRSDERRRIALMEERSVIARELHDSLAQSLSYLKIQVTRLKSHLDGGQTADIVEELKLGLNNAYRQLRELLTTFRLRMDGRGLSDALQDAVREFSQRTGIEFRLHDRLLGHELDASEQIHVLQVVREALANVEHHANAQRADVRLAIEHGRLRVTVDDDGVGIRQAEPPTHHYGLAIMRDRAASLHGTLMISRRPEGGTRVEMEFTPRGPYQSGGARQLAASA
jgi:two-component system nitrate/nitrite sensor histidine kinase NarX